jgi:hypothetical protein
VRTVRLDGIFSCCVVGSSEDRICIRREGKGRICSVLLPQEGSNEWLCRCSYGGSFRFAVVLSCGHQLMDRVLMVNA